MTSFPPEPPEIATEFAEPGFVPPDPDEPPTVDLGSTVGGVPPFGTVLVLLACGIVFAAQAMRGEVGNPEAMIVWGGSVRGEHGLEALWRLLASTFIHGGAIHLLMNAVSLLIFGSAVEAIYARSAFWLIYAIGGAVAAEGSLMWREWRGAGASVSVGASGAIFALAGAVIVAAIRLRGRLAPGRARALGGASLFLVVQSLSSGVLEHSTDNAAHAAGLMAGALLGLMMPLAEPLSGKRPGTFVSTAGVLAALVLALAYGFVLARGLGSP